MKKLYILALAAAISLSASARTVSYARANQNVTFDLHWGPDNYGDIQWQTSTDGGNTWTNVRNATKPVFTVKPANASLYRAVITGDPSCPPIIDEREIRTVNFTSEVTTSNPYSIEMEIDPADLADLDIVEYGFTSMLNGVSRTYTIVPRHKVGEELPSKDNSFTIECDGLTPNTTYSLRAYFVTSDGSIIYGPEMIEKTAPGVYFSSENWIIEKSLVNIPVRAAGLTDKPTIQLFFGTDRDNLKEYRLVQNGDLYTSSIRGTKAGTTYLCVIKGEADGREFEIEKTVTTMSDYSSVEVDNTVKPVSHSIEWNRTIPLRNLTPETKQVEYPRMCRVDENKILLTYHGGTSDHWQNSYLRKSYDNGKTWTEPVEIYNITGEFYGNRYWRICNPEMTRLANGWIILTVIANGNPEGNNNSKVFASISKDGGETWGDPIIVGRGRTWEPQVIQLPNGELELLVSSEAAWWGESYMQQQILSTRSTDNGETWTTYKRASFKPGARDGMPVAVLMQGNKGVLFIEESVNGGIPPSLQHRDLNKEWDTLDWDGTQDSQRWLTSLPSGAGAPHMIQLPTGEFLIMAHANQTGSVWQTCRPSVIMADNTGHNFKYFNSPLANHTELGAQTGAYYNSFFLYDNDTVWMLITRAQYDGDRRVESDIMVLEGKIVEK